MTTSITQLWGMIRYEALMQWRRRTLILLTGFFIVGVIGLGAMIHSTRQAMPERMQSIRFETTPSGEQITIITYNNLTTDETYDQTLTGDAVAAVPRWLEGMNLPRLEATSELLLLLSPALLVLLLAIPPMLAEIIPLDHQYRVRELIDSKPVARAQYLGAKLLSVWLGLAVALAVSMILIGLYATVTFGEQEIILLIFYGLLVLLPSAWLIAGFGALLAGLAKTRRTGVFIGIATLPISVLLSVNVITQSFTNNPLFAPVVSARYDSFNDLMIAMFSKTLEGLIPFIAALFGVWVLLWWVERRRSG